MARERSVIMRVRIASLTIIFATGVLFAAPAPVQEKGGQEEYGPYELVENWPQPLPDGADGVKHAGWTWGSVGAVWAETPDRIWIAQRGELPLPEGAKPWTPYGMLQPPRSEERRVGKECRSRRWTDHEKQSVHTEGNRC